MLKNIEKKIVYISIILIIAVFYYLKSATDYSVQENDKSIVELVIDEIESKNIDRILLSTKDVCHSCLKTLIDSVKENQYVKRNIYIILLGQKEEEISELNIIYRRFNVKFLHVNNSLYKIIEHSEKKYELFVGLKRNNIGKLKAYEGDEKTNVSEKTLSVINFILN